MFKSNKKIKLALAPMAGFTDKAFRQICVKNGVDITWSEMISAEGLVRQSLKNNKSLALAEKFGPKEKKYWVQIFGSNPSSMATASKIIADEIKPFGIDINLGCPVKKAQKAGYGSIQIKNIHRVVNIIKAIKKEISLPLSLKTRVGLKNPEEILEFAPKLEKAGIDQLVVHARTLKGMFHETPHWKIVKQLNSILSIPIIYNGGIKTSEDIKFYAEKTGCQTLMIGQSAIGNPQIFNNANKDSVITKNEKLETIFQHAKLVKKYYGEKGLISFRAHFSAYLKNYQNARQFRRQAVQIKSLKDVQYILQKIKEKTK
ncbi:MAG TPA: tRNA-dihydrouridine synthase family protein [Candidatus Moranbacteria bacterium]|nr:tRNA-dihydrouridine synthase family protein [Candidatus Moranbacteria bacterium]